MELSVVMVILAVTFALILPLAENATPGYRLGSAARIVGSNIASVHGDAVASRRPFAIVYDFDQRQFWIIVPTEQPVDGNPDQTQWVLNENDFEARTPPEDLPRDVIFQSVQTADGQSFQGGQATIRFDSLGNRGSHIVTLGIRDDYGDTGGFQPVSVKYNAMTRSLNYGANLSFFSE